MPLLKLDFTNQEIQEVKLEEVRNLFKPTDSISSQDLSGTGFTYRHDWGDKKGTWDLNLNWGKVAKLSPAAMRKLKPLYRDGFIKIFQN